MGLVNTVVPLEELEEETVRWCREMLELSPFALRLLKASFNATEDGLAGHPAARARHEPPLLRQRGGAGGPRRVPREAQARLRQVPAPAVSHLRLWLVAARPRTLPAAVAPVLVGTALAGAEDVFKPLRFAARSSAASSSRSGRTSRTTTRTRAAAPTPRTGSGPVRVTAGGLMPPRRVLVGTWVAFGIAVGGGHLPGRGRRLGAARRSASSRSPPACCTRAGPRPYGYEGLGELFVFVFFGLVAVGGSYFVQTEELHWEAVALGVPVGLLAAAILVVNNVRDIETDRRAGKRTLAVRLGRERRGRRVLGDARRSPTRRFRRSCSSASSSRGSCCRCLAPARAAALADARLSAATAPSLNKLLADTGPAARGLLAPAGRGAPAVVKRDLFVLSLPFREPFVTAAGVVTERRIVLLRLEDEDGAVGYGEAAPFEPYDGVSVARVEARAATARSREELPQAEAAVEMALLDLDARRAGRPIGEPGREAIAVNRTLPAGPPPRRPPRTRRRVCARATRASR